MLSAYSALPLVIVEYLKIRHQQRNLIERVFLSLVVPERFVTKDAKTLEKWTGALMTVSSSLVILR